MREDMKDVIIDRPRNGGDGGKSKLPKGSKKKLDKIPLEEQPKFTSSARKRLYGYDCKQLNEHLGPLVSWLHSQVGRKWDDVWSEVCEGLSVRNATTAHVRDHADHFVEKNCTINEDNEVCDSKGLKLLPGYWHDQFYVCPVSGVLKVVLKERFKKYKKKKDWVDGKDENHRYYLLNEIWYEVELEQFPDLSPLHRVHDMVISVNWKNKRPYSGSLLRDCKAKYDRPVYASKKRQLNKREIRKLDLNELL